MSNISRRKFVSFATMAPLAAAVLSQGPIALAALKDPKGRTWAPLTQNSARKRLQRLHLPNLPLTSHEGKQVLFYDDLVKDKVVSLNFFYANCDEICPLVTANLARVQKILGDQVGRDIHMYSFTLKPEEDTVEVIRKYREMHGRGPGWSLFTGCTCDMDKLRVTIGFTYPDPAIDKDKVQRLDNLLDGNGALMDWTACPGMADALLIAETLGYIIHPDRN